MDLNLKNIGYDFVRQYYTILSTCPQELSKYYKQNSIFVYRVSPTETRSVVGQKNIHNFIAQLEYKGCKANILSVNTQNLYNYIVISVVGELTKYDSIPKKFTQTIVLDHSGKDEHTTQNNMMFNSDDTAGNNVETKFGMCSREWRNEKCMNVSLSENMSTSFYPPLSHQLIVSDIPANIKTKDLRHFFEQYGNLHSMRIMNKRVNYGFITYVKSESVTKVLQNRPIIFPDESGVWLVVKPKRKNFQGNTHPPTNHQLFIGDIPHDVTSDDLKCFFCKWGDIISAKIFLTEEKNVNTTEVVQGFVTFETKQSVRALLKNQPIMFPNKNGIELKVMIKPEVKPNKSYNYKYSEQEEFQTVDDDDDDKSIVVCF